MYFIKKATNYLLTYSAATLFVYFVFEAGIFFSLQKAGTTITEEMITRGIILPFIYSFFAIIIMAIFQKRIGEEKGKQSLMIYGIFNIVFFVICLALAIIMLVMGLQKGAISFSVASIPTFTLSIIEILVGVMTLLKSNKIKEVAENEEKPSITEEKK